MLGTASEARTDFPDLSLSPDGTRAAYAAEEQGSYDIWILDLKRGGRTRFTIASEPDGFPCWTPSGQEIAFGSLRSGNGDIFLQSADGSGETRAVIAGPSMDYPTGWSPDGRTLLFGRIDPKTGNDIWYARRKPDGAFEEPASFLQTSFDERRGQFSPDGRHVVYDSNESGRMEVYVRTFPDGGGRLQISTQGGDFPRWRRDGREVFYLRGDALFAVPVSLQGSRSAGAPVELFRNPGLVTTFNNLGVPVWSKNSRGVAVISE
jgi:Tol biopolymer transport system component